MAKGRRERGKIVTKDWEILDPGNHHIIESLGKAAAAIRSGNTENFKPADLEYLSDVAGAYRHLTIDAETDEEAIDILLTIRKTVRVNDSDKTLQFTSEELANMENESFSISAETEVVEECMKMVELPIKHPSGYRIKVWPDHCVLLFNDKKELMLHAGSSVFHIDSDNLQEVARMLEEQRTLNEVDGVCTCGCE